MPQDGQPSASQLLLFCDALAGELKRGLPYLGLNLPGEAGTLAAQSDLTYTRIVGDGVTYPGLGNPTWQAQAAPLLAGHRRHCRADVFFASDLRQLMAQADQQVSQNMPKGWSFLASAGQSHAFDFHLTRLNALSPSTPATPTLNGTLTGIYDPTGTLPNVSMGNAPSVVYTLVGASDYLESLPSPAAPLTQLIGSQNAYQFQAPGNVPNGVSKIRVYRTYVGAAGTVFYWDQDALVYPGSPFPTLLISQPDGGLRRDVSPPVWMQCVMMPEFAALWAWCFAGQGQAFGAQGATGSLVFSANAMLSPWNVLLNASNGFVGVGNGASASVFGVCQVTGSNTQTFTAGQYAALNVPALSIQGYAGSGGLQARVTSALNGTCTPSLTYTYLNAAGGQAVGTATGVAGSVFGGTSVGSLATFAVPAGTLVLSAAVTGISGTATAGAFVVEGSATRAY